MCVCRQYLAELNYRTYTKVVLIADRIKTFSLQSLSYRLAHAQRLVNVSGDCKCSVKHRQYGINV